MIRGIGLVGLSIGMASAGAAEAPVVAPKPVSPSPAPFCDACRVHAAPKPDGPILPVQDGPAFGGPGPVPGPLPLPEEAAPLHSSEPSPALRELLDRYLPDVSADERRAWAEELRLLPPELARDILIARSHSLGSQPSPDAAPLPPSEEPFLPPQLEPDAAPSPEPLRIAQAAPSIPAGDGTLVALKQAEAIRLHNIANAESVGFKRVRPTFDEAVATGGIETVTAGRVETQGELEATDRPFDLALDGAGFFQVRRGDAVAVTRRGTFRLVDGEMVLVVAGEAWSLHPPVQIPVEATEIAISEDGGISCRLADEEGLTPVGRIELARVLDTSHLEPSGGGLLTVPESAGAVTLGGPGTSGFGVVRQGRLERSNVDLDVELKALERLRRQIAALQIAAPSQLAMPNGEAGPVRSAETPARPAY
jgi:flagellar basal-body rod protein FlgG